MRILNFFGYKWDRNYLIAYLIAIILAIISGIVLYIINNLSVYIYNFASDYVFYVFNFQNGTLFVSHLISELFYLCVIFLIVYFLKLKFLAVPILFLRCVVFFTYAIILCANFVSDGIAVVLIVFLPSFIFSVLSFIFISEQSSCLRRSIVFAVPAICSILNTVIFLLLVNIVFRVVVVIV